MTAREPHRLQKAGEESPSKITSGLSGHELNLIDEARDRKLEEGALDTLLYLPDLF